VSDLSGDTGCRGGQGPRISNSSRGKCGFWPWSLMSAPRDPDTLAGPVARGVGAGYGPIGASDSRRFGPVSSGYPPPPMAQWRARRPPQLHDAIAPERAAPRPPAPAPHPGTPLEGDAHPLRGGWPAGPRADLRRPHGRDCPRHLPSERLPFQYTALTMFFQVAANGENLVWGAPRTIPRVTHDYPQKCAWHIP
jgi:hypothetical protein